jgi:peptidyl-prolyl cis-trans isomerase D
VVGFSCVIFTQLLLHASFSSKFSVGKYKALLKMNGLVDVEYERMQADALMQNQIRYNILDSAFVTPSALKRMQSLNDQQRKFSYIKLDTKNYIDEVKVEPESVREFFDENKQAFLEPQKVKVDFIELSTKEIAKSIKVNDKDLLTSPSFMANTLASNSGTITPIAKNPKSPPLSFEPVS